MNNLWQDTCAETFGAPALDRTHATDLLVIGGGFTGCSAALKAAEMGADVTLLEAETVGYGGSGRNVGLANAGLWLPPDDVCSKMGQEAGDRLNHALATGPDLVFDLITKHEIQCDPVRNGTLHLAHSKQAVDHLKTRLEQFKRQGAPVALLDQSETCERTGSSLFHAALHDRRAGTIQPLAYVKGLARAALAAGAKIFEKTPVRRISQQDGQWIASTKNGNIKAKSLLLATNAYRGYFKNLSHPETSVVNYFQIATEALDARQRQVVLPNGEGAWDTALIMTSFRIDDEGRLLIGGMGNGSMIHSHWAQRKLAQVFPDLGGVGISHCWTGRISMTADHLPRILKIGPKAYSIFGYSGRGISPGTVFGTAISQFILTSNEATLPITPCVGYSETTPNLKSLFFETGAKAVHLVSAR